MSVTNGLTRDEYQQLAAQQTNYECPIERNHNILSMDGTTPERECFACASIAVLALLVQQNDTGNDLTREAQQVLDDYFLRD